MSRVSSLGDCRNTREKKEEPKPAMPQVSLFQIIQQLAAAENALWNILDSLKSNTTHASFFCREYWGSSASQAQVSLEKLQCNERLKRQVQQAGVLESLSLGVASHLCSGVMSNISVTIRSRLRNLLYYIHENCLVLLDMVYQRWLNETQNAGGFDTMPLGGHCPENLSIDILVRVKRYRRLRRGEHVMALRQHNEMITNVVRQLCRGAAVPKRAPLSSRSSPGDRSPGLRSPAPQGNVLGVVNEVLTARTPLERLSSSTIRSKMLRSMSFRALLNIDGSDPDCPWPSEDPYDRYGAELFARDGPVVWFEPLPPMLPKLEQVPKLPPIQDPEQYTLVLDLDETLVHYYENDGAGNYDIRPGMPEFLNRMNKIGYEVVIFTAATQDYADWVIDQIDPGGLIHHRLYRQHALPWGPIFVKDLSKLGRDLDRMLIIDNVQENFMLQPGHGIFIFTWYDDPGDTALLALTPLLEELLATKAKVPEILDKYRDQIPTWAGFDSLSQLGDYSDDMVDNQAMYYGQQAQMDTWEQEAPQAGPYHGMAASHMQQAPIPCQQPQPPMNSRLPLQVSPPSATQGYPQQAQQPAPPQRQAPTAPQQQQQQQPQPQPPPAARPAQQPPQSQQRQAPQAPRQALQPQAPIRQHVAAPAPAFSGVAGPYQAPAPAQAHRSQPASAAAWNRAGMGPCQAPRR